MRRLEGKIAVVTGAAQGFGRAISIRLAEEGAKVIGFDLMSMDTTGSAVEGAGSEFISRIVDVTDEQEVTETLQSAADSAGGLDILVNNAGMYPFTNIDEINSELWHRMMALNLNAPFYLSMAALPYLKKSGSGRIINMASNAPWLVAGGMAVYIASKMGVIGWTRGLATEVADFGITVNAIGPSLTRTPGTARDTPKEFFDAIPSAQAIHRLEEPEDIVGAVAFFASSDSAFITGQTLMVDGGLARL